MICCVGNLVADRTVLIRAGLYSIGSRKRTADCNPREPVVRLRMNVPNGPPGGLQATATTLRALSAPDWMQFASSIAYDVDLAALALQNSAGDEARQAFLMMDIPGTRSATPQGVRPAGAVTPPQRPATPSAEGLGIDPISQPLNHGMELAHNRLVSGLFGVETSHQPPKPI